MIKEGQRIAYFSSCTFLPLIYVLSMHLSPFTVYLYLPVYCLSISPFSEAVLVMAFLRWSFLASSSSLHPSPFSPLFSLLPSFSPPSFLCLQMLLIYLLLPLFIPSFSFVLLTLSALLFPLFLVHAFPFSCVFRFLFYYFFSLPFSLSSSRPLPLAGHRRRTTR